MAKRKPSKAKKDAKQAEAPKPAVSPEAMAEYQRIYQEAVAAAAKNRKALQGSDEVKKAAEEGRKSGAIIGELHECHLIVDRLKDNPATVSMTYIRDLMIEYKVEGISKRDLDLLKKHHMHFPHSTKVKRFYPTNFSSFGDAYIRRGGRKIPLQKDGRDDPTLIMRDGDVVCTGKDSYVELSEGLPYKPKRWENLEYRTGIMLFPGSEARLSLDTKTTEPEPYSGDGMAHPASTVAEAVSRIELLKGIFKIDIVREKADVNHLIRMPPGYPKIEFRPGMSAAAGVYDDVIDKLKSGKMRTGASKEVMEQIIAKYSKAKQRAQASVSVTDRINSYVELCDDGSFVVFGGNQVRHVGVGKESGRIMKEVMTGKVRIEVGNPKRAMMGNPAKITVTPGGLYETNCWANPDPRVEMITKKEAALRNYRLALSMKADLKKREEKIARGELKPKYDPNELKEEAKRRLADAEEIGDKELIEMAKQELKTVGSWESSGTFRQLDAAAEFNVMKQAETIEKYERESKPILAAPLPPYNSPAKSDEML